MMMDWVPWVEKYRPSNIEDLHVDDDLKTLLEQVSDPENCKMPHILMYGPPGTGKTSAAMLISKQFFGSSNLSDSNTLKLNASDERGIEHVRNRIKSFASESTDLVRMITMGRMNLEATSIKSEYKLIILDECDALTEDAQSALRRVMEDYSKTTRFIFMCNNVQKLLPAIVSRCRSFRFSYMGDQSVIMCISRIVVFEELSDILKNAALVALVKTSNGDVRTAINNLQCLAMRVRSNDLKEIVSKDVYELARYPSPGNIAFIVNVIKYQNCSFRQQLMTIEQVTGSIPIARILCSLQDYFVGTDSIDLSTLSKLSTLIAELEFASISIGVSRRIILAKLITGVSGILI